MSQLGSPSHIITKAIRETVGENVAHRPLAGQILLAAAHAHLNSEQAQAFIALCEQQAPENWPSVFQMAGQHHLRSLLWSHLAEQQLATLIDPLLWEQERHYYQQQLLRQMRLMHALKQAATLYESAGIRFVPLKGPLLGQRIYGHLGPRPSQDIDLLIDPQIDHLDAYRVLQPLWQKWEHRAIHVELAWSLIHRLAYRSTFAMFAIWDRTSTLSQDGFTYSLLHPYDEIRYLCVHHVIHHDAATWLWLVDIAELLQAFIAQGIWNWEEFLAEAQSTETAMPILLVCLQLIRLLDFPSIPDEALIHLSKLVRSPREQQRWAARKADFASVQDALALLRLGRSPEDFRIFLQALLWPDLPYLQEYHGWHYGQDPTQIRFERLSKWQGHGNIQANEVSRG